MSNPYEAAINNLKFLLEGKDPESYIKKQSRFSLEEGNAHIESAIRLLEAAGKMCPEDIVWLRHRVDRIEEYAPLSGCASPGRSRKDRFCALIEALHGESK